MPALNSSTEGEQFYMSKKKMDSRELGLVLGQQILGVEDLHYGLWEDDLELNFSNISIAQQRYTEKLLSAFPAPGPDVRVLDIGCGTGHILSQMLARGYHADGVIPAAGLSKLVKEKLTRFPGNDSRVFECKLEEFPVSENLARYDVALFSESFQYIPPKESLPILEKILKPGGIVVICDFFKTEHHRDGKPGDRSFGGGHRLTGFYDKLQNSHFLLEVDEDITPKMSPNIALLNDFLMHKVKPVSETLGTYLQSNYPKSWWIVSRLFRRKLDRIKYKYFSGHRSKEVFERYKSYRFMVLRLNAES